MGRGPNHWDLLLLHLIRTMAGKVGEEGVAWEAATAIDKDPMQRIHRKSIQSCQFMTVFRFQVMLKAGFAPVDAWIAVSDSGLDLSALELSSQWFWTFSVGLVS